MDNEGLEVDVEDAEHVNGVENYAEYYQPFLFSLQPCPLSSPRACSGVASFRRISAVRHFNSVAFLPDRHSRRSTLSLLFSLSCSLTSFRKYCGPIGPIF